MSFRMRMCSWLYRRGALVTAAIASLTATSMTGVASADEVAFDDFEVPLVPFTVVAGETSEPAYFGWTAMDVDSWIAEQGGQDRDGSGGLGSTTNNTLLVADPDAWDDFTGGTSSTGYNSYISRTYDLTGFSGETTVSFIYEFRVEDSQVGIAELSFDGGDTWQELVRIETAEDSSNGGDIVAGTPGVFVSGTDFNRESDEMIVRFGCIEAGNDWWFAIDDVKVETADGFSDFEDFEGLSLEPFVEADGGDGTDWTNDIPGWVIDNSQMVPGVIGDGEGTDWSRDIPNWVVDNSLSLGFSEEGAYDGWAAMDVGSWIAEQGGQGRSIFGSFVPDNTCLVADGDAFYDFDFDLEGNEGAPGNSYNTYITREYDLSGFDNCSLNIEFEYEFRIENQQLGVAEISFDGGSSWTRIIEFDENDGDNNDTLADVGLFDLASYDFTADDITSNDSFSPRQSNTMLLRFGYLNAGNNWWFAIDNVLVEADTFNFVKGDANQNGVANTQDVSVFVSAILNPAGYEATYGVPAVEVFDFNCDGNFNTQDVSGFVNVILGN